MTDSKKLKAIIAERGYELRNVAERMDLSAKELQLRLDNRKEFRSGEAAALCDILDISSMKEKKDIFFTNEDDLKSTPTMKRSTNAGGGRR